MFTATIPRPRCAPRPATRVVGAAEAAPAAPSRVDLEDLVDIIKAVDNSDVVEMELTGKKFSMTVKKHEALQSTEQIPIQAAPAPVGIAPVPIAAPPAPVAPPVAAPAPAKKTEAPAPAEAAVSGVEISAPMSGTVYLRPAPGEPLFVKEGDKVVKGQSICIIEAMKLMNEIEAEVSGTVVKFKAEHGAMITPGDVICVIDPNA